MLGFVCAPSMYQFVVRECVGKTADLSAYEEYMNPTDRDAYLTLVNATHPLASDFIPADLTDLVNTRGDGRAMQKMSLYAAKALEALFIEAKAENRLTVNPKSGWRTIFCSFFRMVPPPSRRMRFFRHCPWMCTLACSIRTLASHYSRK